MTDARSAPALGGGLTPDGGVAPASRLGRGRAWARGHIGLLALVSLPVLVFGAFAISGHVLMEGDNLIQNFPLRALVGLDLRHGHLPLWDPYLAGGSPLLAGFNAGAAYPATWLFAVLPAQGAWTVDVILVYVGTLLGMYTFLRRQPLSPRAATLGAAAFAFGGFMSAQFVHLDLVEGASWLPWALVALQGMAEAAATGAAPGRDRRRRPDRRRFLRCVVLLGVSFALVVLSGAAEASIDGGILLVMFASWLAWRLPSGRRLVFASGLLSGLLGGLAGGAAQLLPGLVFNSQSQRADAGFTFFTSGSLPARSLALLFSPFLLGTNQDRPSYYFGQYNFPEVTSYVGILALVGAFALLARRWWRHPSASRWRCWHVIGIVGILLALGGSTPVSHLLYLIPVVNGQRLLNRNLMIVDLSLCVLFAWWLELALLRPPEPSAAAAAGRRERWWRSERATASVPVAVVLVLAVGTVLSSVPHLQNRLEGLLGGQFPVNEPTLEFLGFLATLTAVLALAGAGLVWWRKGIPLRWLGRSAAILLAVDLALFNGFVLRPPEPRSVVTDHGSAADRLAALTGPDRRYAVYDPDQFYGDQLLAIGQDDLNVLRGLPSVEGYTALVDNGYFQATGAHGQDTIAPLLPADALVDQLDLGTLASLPSYFVTPTGAGSSPLPVPKVETGAPPPLAPDLQDTLLAPGAVHTWYVGEVTMGRRLDLSPADPSQGRSGTPVGAGARTPVSALDVSVVTASGSVEVPSGTTVTPTGGGGEDLTFARGASGAAPQGLSMAGVVVRNISSHAVVLAPPVLDSADLGSVELAGQLQQEVEQPEWRFVGMIGSFSVFRNEDADGWGWLDPGASGRAAAGSVVRTATSPWGTETYAVDAAVPSELVRSETYAPGWVASVAPAAGRARTTPVVAQGVLQGVAVPAGRSVVTFTYRPVPAEVGIAVSSAAVLLALALLVIPSTLARDRRFGDRRTRDRRRGERRLSERPRQGDVGHVPRDPVEPVSSGT